jgi:hypothetical protein
MIGFPVRPFKKGFGFTGTVCKQNTPHVRSEKRSQLQKVVSVNWDADDPPQPFLQMPSGPDLHLSHKIMAMSEQRELWPQYQ